LEQVPSDNLHRLENQRQQLGFPFASGAELLYYNKTMFDAAGLDYPTPEWTFQDVLDAAAKLTTDTNGDGQPDQWGYFPNYLNEETYYAVIHRFGGRYISDDGKTGAQQSPEAMLDFSFIQDLSYKYIVAPKPQDLEASKTPLLPGSSPCTRTVLMPERHPRRAGLRVGCHVYSAWPLMGRSATTPCRATRTSSSPPRPRTPKRRLCLQPTLPGPKRKRFSVRRRAECRRTRWVSLNGSTHPGAHGQLTDLHEYVSAHCRASLLRAWCRD